MKDSLKRKLKPGNIVSVAINNEQILGYLDDELNFVNADVRTKIDGSRMIKIPISPPVMKLSEAQKHIDEYDVL